VLSGPSESALAAVILPKNTGGLAATVTGTAAQSHRQFTTDSELASVVSCRRDDAPQGGGGGAIPG